MPESKASKILIFTSKTGGGHISLAEALRDWLNPYQAQTQYQIEMIDPQPRFVHWHYRLVSRHALWLWATEFRLSDHPLPSRSAHRVYNNLMARYIQTTLETSQPDLAITTYPFLTTEVTCALRRMSSPRRTGALRLTGRKIPFVMLFADPNGVHQSWLTEQGADAVFAPTRETYTQALKAGFDPARLHLSGWPVRSQFYRNLSGLRAQMLQEMRLDPERFTIFLQGGGEGAAKFVQTVENILNIGRVQVILAVGTNKILYERFKDRPHLFALPFTKDIAPYMASADVVMGKAGPNMLFESVTLGKPFIATTYIPGQEKANLEFIRRYHLGWVALNAGAQRELVEKLACSPDVLQNMQAWVEEYRQWNARCIETIPRVVEDLLKPGQG